MKYATFEVLPHTVSPMHMIGEVVISMLSEARKTRIFEPTEGNFRQQAYGICFFELTLQNEIVGYFHVDTTPICCGSHVLNIVGDIPQDIVDVFMECMSHTGLMFIVKAKVMPTVCTKLSATVGVFNTKRNDAAYQKVSPHNALGQGYLGLFMEQAKKKFPELKVRYCTSNPSPLAPPQLVGLPRTSRIVRSFNYNSPDFQFIGDNTLFVWGVQNIPQSEAPVYLNIFNALPNVNEMLAISTERQRSAPEHGKELVLHTTQVLVDAGWPVILAGKNPGGGTLLSIHGITKTPAPALAPVVSAEPATK